jgi:hypothetical protein
MTADELKQMSLIHAQFDPSIRRVMVDGIEYFSCVDIMACFTDTANARRLWSDTKKRLERDGVQVYDSIVQLKMTSPKDGKAYATDCADGQTIIRIIQSIPSPKAEPLRQWMAELGYRALEEAANPELAVRRRRAELAKLEKAGYGNHPETQRLRDRDNSIEVFKSLKHSIAQVCEHPKWGQIINAEYQALFGEITSQLKIILQTENVRDGLPSLQLTWLTASERTLQAVIAQQDRLTNEQILDVIEECIVPIGNHLRRICQQLDIHHITGKPLLGEG